CVPLWDSFDDVGVPAVHDLGATHDFCASRPPASRGCSTRNCIHRLMPCRETAERSGIQPNAVDTRAPASAKSWTKDSFISLTFTRAVGAVMSNAARMLAERSKTGTATDTMPRTCSSF